MNHEDEVQRDLPDPSIRPRLGYVGLGDIGRGMATNLAQAGYELKVFDIRPDAMAPALAAGASAAESLADIIDFADIIHVCVVYDEQVDSLINSSNGILERGRPGQLVVVHSTILPETVRRCAEAARQRGIDVLDAPISGARTGAMNGTLTIMVGGSRAAFDRAYPVLAAMGRTIVWIGPSGCGEAAKLANNIMSQGNRLVYLEALRLAESYGVSEEALNEVVNVSTGMSWAQTNISFLDDHGIKHTSAGAPDHPDRFAKDLRYAADIASKKGLQMPLTELSARIAPAEFRDRWANAARLRARTDQAS
jgi:3-hydroxyisobutyrate dehydrogenase